MRTELRILLAISLVLLVMVGSNLLFPPPPPPEGPDTPMEVLDETGVEGQRGDTDTSEEISIPEAFIERDPVEFEQIIPTAREEAPGREVVVEGPLYRLRFSNEGALLEGVELTGYPDLSQGGFVQLIPEWSAGWLGRMLTAGSDTLDLSGETFHVEPAGGLDLVTDPDNNRLRFAYVHESGFQFIVEYTFDPDSYEMEVDGTAGLPDRPLERGVVVTGIGSGLAVVEADSAGDERMSAFVSRDGAGAIRSTPISGADAEVVNGPLDWVGVRNRFFALGIFGETGETGAVDHLGQLSVEARVGGGVTLNVSQELGPGGHFGHSLYLGPQDQDMLEEVGRSFNQVNPVGWSFLRPIIRPFASIVLKVLVFLHDTAGLSYGLALVVFGIAMRIVLWPLNHKAMQSQLRNMAVQPLVQEIQAKYKNDKKKQQEEMMKLYKEHGFNPLGGCVPMLLPWPVLIALFFVFQNTIELRGVPFLWLPDLAGPDPYYVLPLLLGVSMWVLQWVSLRSIDNPNPTMKMMMWMMPIMMMVMFIWFGWASGLSLYYLTANLATLPQQIYVANQRKNMRGKPPPVRRKGRFSALRAGS